MACYPVAVLSAFGSSLTLGGDGSTIRFGNAAVLSATCQADAKPAVAYANQTLFTQISDSAAVQLALVGVAPSCAGASLSTVCASMDEPFGRPATFFCSWSKEDGSAYEAGPLEANSTLYAKADVNLGWQVSLTCPVPPAGNAVYGAGDILNTTLILGVMHRPPSLPSLPILFHVQGHAIISFKEPPFARAVATGGDMHQFRDANGVLWQVHVFLKSGTLTWTSGTAPVQVLLIGGGGSGGGRHAGGGGGGGVVHLSSIALPPGTYAVTVGAGGAGVTGSGQVGKNGGDSSFLGQTAVGGGGGGSYTDGTCSRGARTGNVCSPTSGGSGGGAADDSVGTNMPGGASTQGSIVGYTGATYGHAGGVSTEHATGAGGGGAAGDGTHLHGGPGVQITILEKAYYWGGGGGGAHHKGVGGAGGIGGGGGGGAYPAVYAGGGTPGGVTGGDGSAYNLGESGAADGGNHGGDAGANTGGGGGACAQSPEHNGQGYSGDGGSGIMILRYPLSVNVPEPAASGGHFVRLQPNDEGAIAYYTHAFTSVGSHSLQVSKAATVDVLIVGGGGSGGGRHAGGGGGGGVVHLSSIALPPGTYAVTVGAGGAGVTGSGQVGKNGGDSSFLGQTAVGGGGGGSYTDGTCSRGARTGNVCSPTSGGSGGGAADDSVGTNMPGGASTQGSIVGYTGATYGHAGGVSTEHATGAGGGGAAGDGTHLHGGPGVQITILEKAYYWGGGGGGAHHKGVGGAGGIGGGGGGGAYPAVYAGGGTPGGVTGGDGSAYNLGESGAADGGNHGGDAGANTGGGGGACAQSPEHNGQGYSGDGGTGIVIVRVHI